MISGFGPRPWRVTPICLRPWWMLQADVGSALRAGSGIASRSPGEQAWQCAWEDSSWTAPIVSLFADVGW